MPTHQENLAAVQNALQFLGPLGELEKSLKPAAEAEKFLKDSSPKIAQLKDKLDEVRGQLQEAQAAVADEQSRLKRLQDIGVREMAKSIADVTQSQRDQLLQATRDHEDALKGLGRAKADLNSEIDRLTRQRDSLGSQVAGLNGQLVDVQRKLAAIAKQAGGN